MREKSGNGDVQLLGRTGQRGGWDGWMGMETGDQHEEEGSRKAE